MSWLQRILGRREVRRAPAADRLQGAVDRVAGPPSTALPRSAYLVDPAAADGRGHNIAIKRRQTFGEFEVREYSGGAIEVNFESNCQCEVNISSPSWAAAVYLATALDMCATGCDVDVQLDRVLA